MSPRRLPGRIRLAALIAPLLFLPAPALAQQGAVAETGRQLFQYGRAYYDRGQWSEALDAFRGSLDALPSPNTRLYVGRCLRELGRPADAWLELERAADEADASRDPRYARTADTARQESAALADRVAFLVVELREQAPGVAVQVSGRPLPPERWGRLYAVEPGSITVDATAEGYAPFRATSTLAAGQQGRVAVTLTPASVAGPAAPLPRPDAVTVLSVNDRRAIPVAPAAPPEAPRSPWRGVGIAAMGVGVALGVAGLVTGLRAAGLRGDLDAECPRGCGPNPSPAVLDAVDEGNRMVLLTNLAWGAGAALLVGGAVAFFAGGGTTQELYAPTFARNAPPRRAVRPFLDPSRGAAGLAGSF